MIQQFEGLEPRLPYNFRGLDSHTVVPFELHRYSLQRSKGIFARYLAQLRDVLDTRKIHPEIAQEIDRCLRASAVAIIENGTGADGLYPAEWHKGARDTKTNFNTQVSALAALVAAIPPAPPAP